MYSFGRSAKSAYAAFNTTSVPSTAGSNSRHFYLSTSEWINFIVFSRLSLENYEKSCENRFRELQEMYCAREMDGLLTKDPYCLLYLMSVASLTAVQV